MKRLLYSLLALVLVAGCAQKTALFNGKNLDGWTVYPPKAGATWSVQDGVLSCSGDPVGYIRTVESYCDYQLHLEWRWPDKPTNSGVLLHSQGEDKIFPLCIEAQLMHENAGDFVTIQKGSRITVNGTAYEPTAEWYHIIPKQQPVSEKPAGEWNRYDIICNGNTIELQVNGVLQNRATNTSLTAGSICLQSEGSPIEFRNITLTPLK